MHEASARIAAIVGERFGSERRLRNDGFRAAFRDEA
jgi:hypothetical protein